MGHLLAKYLYAYEYGKTQDRPEVLTVPRRRSSGGGGEITTAEVFS